jgi:glutamate--cysteine ligase
MAYAARSTVETIHQVGALFGPGIPVDRPPSIGVEAEFLLFRAADRGETVAIDDARRGLETEQAVARLGRASFEPGGQLELSPAAAPSPASAIKLIDALSRRTANALRRHDIEMVAAGVDHWRSTEVIGLQTPGDRYLAMQAHFDSIGQLGRRMMRQTASLQVCVDRIGGPNGARQWLAANLVGPALAAAFRNSRSDDNRTAIWLGVDESRTGLDGRQVDGRNPVGAYARFALAAEVMALPRTSQIDDRPPARSTLGAWIARSGARPDPDDIAHHLSTLFPPVRPRGRYLEIRYLDAQPSDRRSTAIALLAILLADTVARETALEITGGGPSSLDSAWIRSARYGIADPFLLGVAFNLVSVAVERVGAIDRRWPGWLPGDARELLGRFAADLETRRPAAVAS